MAGVEAGLLGGRVPYIRGGSGQQEAVVFFGINALFKRLDRASDPGRYARQVSRLIPGHRFTIFGYTGSGFEEIVGDLASAIHAPADVLVGIPFGGFVAMRFAGRHPELVKRLILLASAHRFSTNEQRMLARQIEALERRDPRTLVRENAPLFRRPWYNWLARLVVWKNGDRLADGRDPAAILRDYRQLFGPDFKKNAEYCGRIVCPTFVMGGTADQYFDREAFEETAGLIPDSRIRLFERETHMLPIEKSGGVARAIEEFPGRS